VGLNGGVELPLLKVCSYGKGWKNACWTVLTFFAFSTLLANNGQTSSKVEYH